ncbi:MAG: recombinase family protein [Sporichthyaceae bacterium]
MRSNSKDARAKSARTQRLAAGKRAGGRRPWGFNIDMTRNAPEAKVVRAAYKRLLRGDSLGSIARWLNEKGHYTTGGTEWIPGNLGQALRRGCYAGLLEYKGELLGLYDRMPVAKPEHLAEPIPELPALPVRPVGPDGQPQELASSDETLLAIYAEMAKLEELRRRPQIVASRNGYDDEDDNDEDDHRPRVIMGEIVADEADAEPEPAPVREIHRRPKATTTQMTERDLARMSRDRGGLGSNLGGARGY